MSEGLAFVAISETPAAVALGALYDAHARRLRGLLVRLGVKSFELDDALQEIFVVACRRFGGLRDPSGAVPWLNGVAVRVASAARRRARWRRFVGLDEAPEPTSSQTPASALENRQALASVHAALEGMSPKRHSVFVLFEIEGWSGEEIAAAVGCPLKTVWTRLYHARRDFLARLAQVDVQHVKQKGQPS